MGNTAGDDWRWPDCAGVYFRCWAIEYWINRYTTISQSLYWGFGHIGGPIEGITVFLAAPLLSFLVRKQRPALWWTLAGTVCFASAFIVFLAFTEPMNREILQWSIKSVPADWTRVRNQWEYSHVARFILQLIGLCAFEISLLVETPETAQLNRH